MARVFKRAMSACAVLAFACIGLGTAPGHALAAPSGYEVYPTPHEMKYADGEQTLRDEVVTVVEDGIDADTEARLEEALALKGAARLDADAIPTSKSTTALLVGVKGSGGAVDKHVGELVDSGRLKISDDLFSKTDAYLLASLPSDGAGPDQVIVLGRDTDAAYYALTTLYQILQQIDGAKMRAFTMCDYADVISRGFIEGYYGNPWSTEDRIELMRWGGYYKLNAYFYAPKDDPKHNKNWREPYTEQELKDLIEPLAKAGNASKVRFVYALHPFMSNPITSANYDTTFPVMKEKFLQVIDGGVRQIAILADDATNQGDQLYTKLLKDTTDWLHELQQMKNADGTPKYPGLKDTLIFCPERYMGNGEGWYKNLPDTVQVINTGGRVWGKIDSAFANTFKLTSGVAPFMWINWPCSDNDKDALHMGGHNNFLGADLKPGQVKGVVINPMQQSEPSKQGIFMNADFTWNLWESTAHADALWERSFSYIDHNSGAETKGSNALRELSRHMTRMYGGGATWENGESSAIKEKLTAFRTALSAGTVTDRDCDEMIGIFTEVQTHAKNYRVNAGTERMAAQMDPFLSTWDDLTVAAIEGLSAIKADLAGDASNLLAHYTAAVAAFDAANGHGYRYVDHTEYARVGKAHITPMVNDLMDDISVRATIAADPEATVRAFVTSRMDVPTGKTSNVFDGDLSTGVTYANPNSITTETYVGMKQNRPFDLTRFTITYDAGHPNGIINTAKLQVLRRDGAKREVWEDVDGKTVSNSTALSVDFTEMDEKGVYGVRLIATADNAKAGSLTINELEVNKVDAPAGGPVLGTAVAEGMVVASNADASSKDLANVTDDSATTFTHFRRVNDGSNPERDYLPAGAAVRVNFAAPEQIDSIYFKQAPRTGDEGNGGDGVKVGRIQYLPAGAPSSSADAWVDAATVNGSAEYRVKLEAPVAAQAIRVVNDEATKSWWKVFSLRASLGEGPGEPAATPVVTTNMNPYDNNTIGRVIDGDESTMFWSGATVAPGQWIMYSFGESKAIDTVRMLQDNGDRFLAADVSYTTDANPNAERSSWTKIGFMGGDRDQTIAFDAVEATAIKIEATRANDRWFKVFEIEAYERHAHSADNIRATFKGDVPLTARVGCGQAVAAGRLVTLPDVGDVVAIDLGGVRREVAVAHAPQVQNAELVWSQNALEWKAFDGSGKVPARYVGYRSTQAGSTLDLDGFALTYLESLDPRVVSSDLPGDQTLNAAKVFDGDVKTATKSSGHPSQGDAILFDLGQERTITSLEYYVPETSLDFIRNAVIEVASRADAPADEWTKVVDINGDNRELPGAGVDNIAKEYAALTHSSTYPGNMMASSSEGTNVTARYLRIRFTKTFADRWVEIGELRINGGERVSAYAGDDFETSSIEQAGKSPSNMIDGDMNTAWAPQGNTAGDITYNVSDPVRADGKPVQGVRIISRGVPSGATVTANIYTGENASATVSVPLGSMSQNSQEFRFVPAATRSAVGFQAVKNIQIAWGENAAPQIAEIYLLADAPAAQDADIKGLRDKIDAANEVSKDTWTTASQQKLEAAVKAAEEALKKPETMTPAAVATLLRQIDVAMASPVLKYADGQLKQLVDGAHTDSSLYTAQSWAAYQDALVEAKKALEDPDNISQATGEALAGALANAQAGLVPSTIAADRAEQAIEDARAVYGGGSYTASSRSVWEGALDALKKLVEAGEKNPTTLGAAMNELAAAGRALVDVSALDAARAEFDTTNAAAYTPESFAAYCQAFDASTPLLQSATAEQVAAAVEALKGARAGLVALDLDALIAECDKLAKGDYTEASWNAFGTALAAAKAGKDGADAPQLADALAKARAALVNVVALKDAIARADAIDASRFTPESVAKLADAVAAGRSAQLAGSAEDVEQARLAIVDALDGLTVNSGGNGDAGDAGGEGSGGVSGGSGNVAGHGGNGASGGLPSTGDGSMLPVIAVGALGAAATLAGIAGRPRYRGARGGRDSRPCR